MKKSPKIVLIDNNDSFTYNIVQVIRSLGFDLDVVLYRDINFDILDYYTNIIISPGPDVPSAYPNIFKLIDRYKTNKRILGICLGFQAISEFFGAKLYRLDYPLHGIKSEIKIDNKDILYKGFDPIIEVGRYHSWAVGSETIPPELKISAKDSDNITMSVTHSTYSICGMQYHPESIMTPQGRKILKNWIDS